MPKISSDIVAAVRASGLFDGVDDDVWDHLLECLGARVVEWEKGEIVVRYSQRVNDILYLLDGTVYSVAFNSMGKRSLLAVFVRGMVIPGTVKLLEPVTALSDIVAVSNCRFLRLTMNPSFLSCHKNAFHVAQILRNIMTSTSKSSGEYERHMRILAERTIEAKVAEYREEVRDDDGSLACVRMTRQDLADYLQVERTSLSHVIARSETLLRPHSPVGLDENRPLG